MRFNLFYDGELDMYHADISQLLLWLSYLNFDLPDDVIVDIDMKESDKK